MGLLNGSIKATASVIFLQFLRCEVDKIDLERSVEILNAILQFDCRFCRPILGRFLGVLENNYSLRQF